MAGCEIAKKSAERAMALDPKLRLALPAAVDLSVDALLDRLVAASR